MREWWGRRKKKGRGYMGGGKKIKNKWEVGFSCMVGKRGSEKERRKKIEREKTKLILFVCSLCLVQNVEL